MPQERVLNIRYEDFLNDPTEILGNIFQFASLVHSPEVISYAEHNIKKYNFEKWKMHSKLVSKIDYILKPTLKKLDYL